MTKKRKEWWQYYLVNIVVSGVSVHVAEVKY